MNEPVSSSQAVSPLGRLDAWMAAHPWHVRWAPFIVYVAFLFLLSMVREPLPWAYPFVYLAQCSIVVWMLWRYRGLTPELNWRFHWLAVPVAVASTVAWIGLGIWMEQLSPRFVHTVEPFTTDMGPVLGNAALGLRLLGMAIVVPMFEELAFRSAVLRSFYRPADVKVAVLQILSDLPLIGDWVMQTEASRQADRVKRPMAAAFERTPLGQVSAFSVVASLVLWCFISHMPRDWPGTIACGVLFIWLTVVTNRRGRAMGLGPVIWAHGITNAGLWIYTILSGDWRFL